MGIGWRGAPAARIVAVVLTVLLLGWAVAWWGIWTWGASVVDGGVLIGKDAHLYFDRAASWLAGDGFYLPRQLTGSPYVIEPDGVMYPPTILPLLVPFAWGLPQVLWWAVPLAVVGVCVWRARPPWWAWPVLAAVLAYPRTWVVVVLGNPSMWVIAGIVAGVAFGWPAAFALVKPTFAPLALLGVRARSWWLAVAVLVAVTAVAWPMLGDYVTVTVNARTPRGLEYVLGEWPIALGLLVVAGSRRIEAFIARRRGVAPGP